MIMKNIFNIAAFALCLTVMYSCEEKGNKKKDPVEEKVDYFRNKKAACNGSDAQEELTAEIAVYVASLTPEDKGKFAQYSNMAPEELIMAQVEYFYAKAISIPKDDYVAREQLGHEIEEFCSSLTAEEKELFYNYFIEVQCEADEMMLY